MGRIYDAWSKWLQTNHDDDSPGEDNGARKRDKQIFAYITVIGVAGIALLLFADGTPPTPPTTTQVSTVTLPDVPKSTYEDEIERELTVALGQMTGVGDVKVFITWEGGPVKTLATRTTTDMERTEEIAKDGSERSISSERTDSEPVVIQGNDSEEVVVVSEARPKARGVLVVADGAQSSVVKERIMRAVQTALHVPAHQISVVPKKN